MDSCLVSGHGVVVGVDGLVVAGDRVVIGHVELSFSLDDHIGAARRRTPAHQHQDQPSRNAAELQHAGSVISLRSGAFSILNILHLYILKAVYVDPE